VANYFGNQSLCAGVVAYLFSSLILQTFLLFYPLAAGRPQQGALADLDSIFLWLWAVIALVVIFIVWFSVVVMLVRRTVVDGIVNRSS
jgi:hypothetical protein